jgi:hypothetical protein
LAGAKQVLVDVPDTAPPADAAEQGLQEKAAAPATPVAPPPLPKITEPNGGHPASGPTASVQPRL